MIQLLQMVQPKKIIEMNNLDEFRLRRISNKPNSVVSVDFTPILINHTNVKIFPIFNMDRKPYMPSFIIPAEQNNVKNSDDYEKLYQVLHHRKIEELTEESEQLFVPKPSLKNSYCCICRTHFTDYINHIIGIEHKKICQSSSFNEDIKELCKTFREEKKTLSDLENGRPYKKIKIQGSIMPLKKDVIQPFEKQIQSLINCFPAETIA